MTNARTLVWAQVLLVCGWNPAWAQTADPLQSAACVQALQTLQDVETQVLDRAQVKSTDGPQDKPNTEGTRAQLARLQQQAARVCLGAGPSAAAGEAAKRPRDGLQAPGAASRLPTPAPTSPAVKPPVPRSPPTAVVPERPLLSLTSCDANGCWSSDGTRLQKIGSQLLGPRGFCSVQASVLNCP